MNRYLLALLIGIIGLVTLYGVGSSQDVIQRATNASRQAVSSSPTSAAEEGLTGIESAGQNVIRQTSEEGLERSRDLPVAESQTTPTEFTAPATTAGTQPSATFPEQNIEAVQPVAPVTPQQSPQDAIPALW